MSRTDLSNDGGSHTRLQVSQQGASVYVVDEVDERRQAEVHARNRSGSTTLTKSMIAGGASLLIAASAYVLCCGMGDGCNSMPQGFLNLLRLQSLENKLTVNGAYAVVTGGASLAAAVTTAGVDKLCGLFGNQRAVNTGAAAPLLSPSNPAMNNLSGATAEFGSNNSNRSGEVGTSANLVRSGADAAATVGTPRSL